MIKVTNLNGKPESIPQGSFAIHSDDDFFYFFNSEEDRISFFIETGLIQPENINENDTE